MKNKDTPCMCVCHQIDVIHIQPCCNLTYVKYIDDDGKIDWEIYNKAKKDEQNRTIPT